MNFDQAEYKLKAFMRDMGFVGELPHPNEEVSERDSNGLWHLRDVTGRYIAKIHKDGFVRLLWTRES